MGIDIKFPIGLMFSVFGILLTFYGLITNSDAALYGRSLGLNINLWSGAGMLVFGLFMLFLVYRTGRKKDQLNNTGKKV
jgi:hypothetical protein